MYTVKMEAGPMNSEDYIRYLLEIVKRGDGITPEEFDRIFGWGRPKAIYAPNTLTSGVSKLRKTHGAVIEWRDGKYCLISINPAPEPMLEPVYETKTMTASVPLRPTPTEEPVDAMFQELVTILRAILDTKRS